MSERNFWNRKRF